MSVPSIIILMILTLLTACQQCQECLEGYPITTVLVLRHADKIGEVLSYEGCLRANELVHVARKAGVEAIFETTEIRAKQTVKPLALALALEPIEYPYSSNGTQNVVNQVKENYKGKTVLIVGHSDTVPYIIDLLVGEDTQYQVNGEYDNLYIVTLSGNSAKVTNLQYGDLSGPETPVPPCLFSTLTP